MWNIRSPCSARTGASSARSGMMLGGATYDVGVMVMFLFQMVFMDTALTIVTGTAAERWKYSAFIDLVVLHGRVHVSAVRQLGVGRRLAARRSAATSASATATADFAGSGVVHSVGGITALAMAHHHRPAHRQVHPRRQAQRDPRPRHRRSCCSAASSWRSAGSGSTPARRSAPSANGNLRISSVAVNTMLAGMAGSFGAMFYMWIRYGKPDASMTGNGLLAGLVAITAPSGFVNPDGVGRSSASSPACSVCLRRVRRARAEARRSGRRDFGARHERPLGRASRSACSPTARATTAARGTASRVGDRPVLRRRRPARGAADGRRDAARLRLHLQLRAEPGARLLRRPASVCGE